MKYGILLVLFGLMLTLGSGPRDKNLYQVITSHPHDIEELNPYIETVYQNGRLWVVELNEDAPPAVLNHVSLLSGREKSYLYRGSFISNAAKLNTDVDLKSYITQVDSENIRKDVEELAGYATRYAGTTENMQAVDNVAQRFEQMGFKSKKICYNSKTCNLVAEKKGSSDEVLLVVGHIDSVGEDFAGADDNASGVAVMLEMARVLQSYNNKKTIRFLVSNGEELGLIGSTQYVKLLNDSKEIKKLALVINMDMVGYNSNGIVELETNPEFEKLAKWQASLASEYTTLKTKITLGAWGSDHVPFLNKGVPSILTIEDWNTKTPCYHMECDKPDTLNYQYAGEIAKLNVASIMAKDLNL